jgi:transcriptional regulator with XRE-family HTH domain
MAGGIKMWKNLDDEFENFTALLKFVRKDKKIGLDELAQKLKIDPQRMKDIEEGVKYPTKEELKRFSGTLGLDYGQLLIVVGYNKLEAVPSYWTSDGEEIDVTSMLKQIYYDDPSVIPRLLEIVNESQKSK